MRSPARLYFTYVCTIDATMKKGAPWKQLNLTKYAGVVKASGISPSRVRQESLYPYFNKWTETPTGISESPQCLTHFSTLFSFAHAPTDVDDDGELFCTFCIQPAVFWAAPASISSAVKRNFHFSVLSMDTHALDGLSPHVGYQYSSMQT